MPILLTTSVTYPAAHGKPAEVYSELKAHELRGRIHARKLEIQVQYGNTVDGKWLGGKLPIAHYLLENVAPEEDPQGNIITPADPRYDVFMATTFGPSAVDIINRIIAGTLAPTDALAELDQLYLENGEAIYSWLQLQEPSYAGTIQ
ncbi:hypothetical protein LCGC14_0273680 [marine sediment metagenome]|uniref:Uncharacterized protein n=1 Tax=marine sediment metagenome TaxID=412755 RepID=A0A0F9WJ13_9ZZZZ